VKIVAKTVFQLKAKMSRTITVREKRKIDVKLASKRGYFLHRRLSLLYLLHISTDTSIGLAHNIAYTYI
jgi:hypothetical protein